jgi:hypothetical protein
MHGRLAIALLAVVLGGFWHAQIDRAGATTDAVVVYRAPTSKSTAVGAKKILRTCDQEVVSEHPTTFDSKGRLCPGQPKEAPEPTPAPSPEDTTPVPPEPSPAPAPEPAPVPQPAPEPTPAPEPVIASALYVAPTGSDANPGTVEAPFATLQKGLERVGQAGQPRTLYVRGGTYQQRVWHPKVASGSPDNRIRVTAYPGERVVLRGLFHLYNLRYWTIDNLEFTWSPELSQADHMVRFTNGVGWIFENNQVYGARSYAGLHITSWSTSSEPSGWIVRHNRIFDTVPSNGINQDHNVYVSASAGNGVIERNLIYGAPNGENVKIGGGSNADAVSNITVRYNTMYDASSNMLLSGPSSNNTIERNIMYRSNQSGTPKATIMLWAASGTGNVVRDNFVGQSSGLMAAAGGTSANLPAAFDAGGNLIDRDPRFVAAASGDLRPQDPTAATYGAHAP